MKGPEEAIEDAWWNESNRLPVGKKTREEAIDFIVDGSKDIQRLFEEYYAEHGRYLEPADISKPLITIIPKNPGLENKENPGTVQFPLTPR